MHAAAGSAIGVGDAVSVAVSITLIVQLAPLATYSRVPSGVSAMPRGWVPTAIVLTTDGVAAARSMTDTLPVEWFAVHSVRPSRLITMENGSAGTSIGVFSIAGEVLTSIGTTLPQPEAYAVRPSGLIAMPNAPIVPSAIGALATGGDALRSMGCTRLPELAPQVPKLAT